jgi:hypothetical protein
MIISNILINIIIIYLHAIKNLIKKLTRNVFKNFLIIYNPIHNHVTLTILAKSNFIYSIIAYDLRLQLLISIKKYSVRVKHVSIQKSINILSL